MEWKFTQVFADLKSAYKFNQGLLAKYLLDSSWREKLNWKTVRKKISNYTDLDIVVKMEDWFDWYVMFVTHLDLSPRDISDMDSHEEIVAELIKKKLGIPINSIAIEFEDGVFETVDKETMAEYMDVKYFTEEA